jgi:hypothetical protein
MKKIYIAPVCEKVTLYFEGELCKYSNTSGSLSGNNFTGTENDIDTNEDGPDAMHAKGGDFFEESISPRSLWGDDEE